MMIDIDHAAHWAELFSAILVSGVCAKVWRFVSRLGKALHYHSEETGVLEAAGIKKVFAIKAGD